MAKKAGSIYFHHLWGKIHFINRNVLKEFLLRQLDREGKEVDTINYIFCSDDYLLDMNRKYLKHDTLTDIITFELSGNGQPIISDIYISIDRVKENAALYKSSFTNELQRVIFHGALHLSGYGDKGKKQKTLMREKEAEWLIKYKFHVEQKGLKD